MLNVELTLSKKKKNVLILAWWQICFRRLGNSLLRWDLGKFCCCWILFNFNAIYRVYLYLIFILISFLG